MRNHTEQQALPYGAARVPTKVLESKEQYNFLIAKLSVPKLDGSKYGAVIGQVKVDDDVSKEPVAGLYYNRACMLAIGVSQNLDASSLKTIEVGCVDVGDTFEYELRCQGVNSACRSTVGKRRP